MSEIGFRGTIAAKRPRMNLRLLWPLLSLAACSSAPPMEPDHPDPSALAALAALAAIGAPCAMEAELAPRDRFEAPKVLTEIAVLRAPPDYVPPRDARADALLRDPRVSVTQSAHLLGAQGETAVMDTGNVIAPVHSRITVLPLVVSDGVRVTVSIDDSDLGSLATTIQTRDQRPAILGGAKGIVAVVTPYVVRGTPDLKRLYECRAMRSPRGPSP